MGRSGPRDLRPGQSLHPSPAKAPPHRPTGPGTAVAHHLPALLGRLVSGSGQAMPTHRAPHQEPAPYWIRGTVCLRGGTRSARRTTTPPSGACATWWSAARSAAALARNGRRQPDDPGFTIRHLANPGSQPPCRLPTITHYPASLNCYARLAQRHSVARLGRPQLILSLSKDHPLHRQEGCGGSLRCSRVTRRSSCRGALQCVLPARIPLPGWISTGPDAPAFASPGSKARRCAVLRSHFQRRQERIAAHQHEMG